MDDVPQDLKAMGSSMPLEEFHLWFKGGALWRAGRGEIPSALAANGPGQEGPSITEFVITGSPSSAAELVAQLITDWIEQSQASQVALCLPLGNDDDRYELFLFSLDATGVVAEQAAFSREGQLLSLQTQSLDGTWWPIEEWQNKLARHERLAINRGSVRLTGTDSLDGPGF
ncbi:MAG TPA: hypothetical protein VKR79_07565 [Gaiellaceae bacterium]|nr:hypothetical protein [Gaiellaceae bacterium]